MTDAPKTEILRARGFRAIGIEDGRPTAYDRNGNRMLLAEAVLEDGSCRRILAFDKPKGAGRLASPVATDLAKAITEHEAHGMPPTVFILRVRMMPKAINPATKKPYPPIFVVDSFCKTPINRQPKAPISRHDDAR